MPTANVKKTYIVTEGQTAWGYLGYCEGCMARGICAESTLDEKVVTLDGVDPDDTTHDWSNEDISQQGTPRVDTNNRWPYQFLTKGIGGETQNIKSLTDYGCSADCVYLIHIKYSLFTSSRRRSYLQCGLSDMWLVERYSTESSGGSKPKEVFYVAGSLPWARLKLSGLNPNGTVKAPSPIYDDYDVNGKLNSNKNLNDYKYFGSPADQDTYFNPYGLREDYDPLKDKVELHCGTLFFFAKGDDKIKFRLAQHTNLPTAWNLNPSEAEIATSDGFFDIKYCAKSDMTDAESGGNNKAVYTNTKGKFKVDALLRPVPGNTHHTLKGSSDLDEKTIKYYPTLY